LFPFGQDLVELLHGLSPHLAVEGVEGIVVFAAIFRRGLAFESGQFLAVPENQVIGQLTHGMISAAVPPSGLVPQSALPRRYFPAQANPSGYGWFAVAPVKRS